MTLIDFTDVRTLRDQLIAFISVAGEISYGRNYHGISLIAEKNVDLLVTEIDKNKKKIYGIPDIMCYFSQIYVLKRFFKEQCSIKWSPKPDAHYVVDFTQYWDLAEIRIELTAFIRKIGFEEFPDYKISDYVYKGMDKILDSNLYGQPYGVQIKKPQDVEIFFPHYIVEGLEKYQAKIKWMDKDIKSDEEIKKVYMVDFTLVNDLYTLRKQLDAFLYIAGKEQQGADYCLPNNILREIDRLLEKRYYGKTFEHNITKADDLDKFFKQRYACHAFRKYSSKIKWAQPLGNSSRHLPYGYFFVPLRRHILPRIPSFMNPMIEEESWKLTPLERKVVLQKELYYHVGSLPSAIKSPLQVMPPVYARMQSPENDAGWWCTRNSYNRNSGSFQLTSTASQFPCWINDKMRSIQLKGFDVGLKTFLHHGSYSKFDTASHLDAKFTVYCLVVNVREFEKLQGVCHPAGGEGKPKPGSYQVYVGKAKNGLKDRWLKQGYSHCRVTKKLVNHMRSLLESGKPFSEYKPSQQSIGTAQLPQVMLALAKAKFYPVGLFVLRSCKSADEMNEFEGEMIQALKATDMCFGMNVVP